MRRPYDFSFSGLKTAVLRMAQQQVGADHTLPSSQLAGMLNDTQKADIAASFAKTACQTIVDKARRAYDEYAPASVIIGGGVAADLELRRQLAEAIPVDIEYPDRKLCGDNGAMVATLGCYELMTGQPVADPMTLQVAPGLSM
jgi:N6-L-threonylcarbamoyladenine synthase